MQVLNTQTPCREDSKDLNPGPSGCKAAEPPIATVTNKVKEKRKTLLCFYVYEYFSGHSLDLYIITHKLCTF